MDSRGVCEQRGTRARWSAPDHRWVGPLRYWRAAARGSAPALRLQRVSRSPSPLAPPWLWARVLVRGRGRPLRLAGGGLPLAVSGEFLGGVGASGGTEDEDIECARAALDAIGAE
ncbi:MAG: heme-binding protein [Chloroflexi bacterium]|nr:heme-binding protein [Chloroflexota bacterium]